jgi:hypothetical protein
MGTHSPLGNSKIKKSENLLTLIESWHLATQESTA